MDSTKRSARIRRRIINRLIAAGDEGVKRTDLIEAVSHNDYRRGRRELEQLHDEGAVRVVDGRYHPGPAEVLHQWFGEPAAGVGRCRYCGGPIPEPEPASFWDVEFDAVAVTLDTAANFWDVTVMPAEPVSAGSFWV